MNTIIFVLIAISILSSIVSIILTIKFMKRIRKPEVPDQEAAENASPIELEPLCADTAEQESPEE